MYYLYNTMTDFYRISLHGISLWVRSGLFDHSRNPFKSGYVLLCLTVLFNTSMCFKQEKVVVSEWASKDS